MGALFDHSDDGQLHLAREGGHSHHRIVHAADMTGREIERALLASVSKCANITMFAHHFAIDLLTKKVFIEAIGWVLFILTLYTRVYVYDTHTYTSIYRLKILFWEYSGRNICDLLRCRYSRHTDLQGTN